MRVNKRRQTYYADFTHFGIERRLSTGFTNQADAADLARNLRRLVVSSERREPPSTELDPWLRTLSPRIRRTLVKWRIIDPLRDANAVPIAQHVDVFRTHLKSKGTGPDHTNLVCSRVERIINGVKATRWSDLTEDRVKRFLTEM